MGFRVACVGSLGVSHGLGCLAPYTRGSDLNDGPFLIGSRAYVTNPKPTWRLPKNPARGTIVITW